MKKKSKDKTVITKEVPTLEEFQEEVLEEVLEEETPKTLIKKLFPFPLKIPLSYDGKKIGNLKIDFDYSLSLREMSKMSSNIQQILIFFYYHLWDESLSFSKRLESDLALIAYSDETGH